MEKEERMSFELSFSFPPPPPPPFVRERLLGLPSPLPGIEGKARTRESASQPVAPICGQEDVWEWEWGWEWGSTWGGSTDPGGNN